MELVCLRCKGDLKEIGANKQKTVFVFRCVNCGWYTIIRKELPERE